MKSILITGGSGYFSQGMVKHLLDNNLCDRIVIFSRGEFNQAHMRKKFNDDKRLRWAIGDVRDCSRLTWAMNGCDLVIAAAALKRVEVGEANPEEMVKTNVDGAMSVIKAAREAAPAYSVSRDDEGTEVHGIRRKVIFLSTDKACNPLNTYGATKLVAEKLFLAANNTEGPTGPMYSVCRYGNIAGSTGSVIPTWRSAWIQSLTQSPAVAEVTVTNPDATRFWMSREEAVKMVLWTAQAMRGGELIVPSLPAYRLGDLLEAMNLTANVTQLGAGEKIHEQMISGYEANQFQRCGDFWVAGLPPPFVVSGDLAKDLNVLPGGITIADNELHPTWTAEVRKTAFSSHHARRMSVEELRKRLGEIEC